MSSSLEYVMDTQLHQAVESGNIQAVQKLIAKGAKINARNKNNVTPFHYAADVNSPANNGLTPLIRTICRKYYGIFELLLQNGCQT